MKRVSGVIGYISEAVHKELAGIFLMTEVLQCPKGVERIRMGSHDDN